MFDIFVSGKIMLDTSNKKTTIHSFFFFDEMIGYTHIGSKYEHVLCLITPENFVNSDTGYQHTQESSA